MKIGDAQPLIPVDSRFRGNDGVGLPSIFIAIVHAVATVEDENGGGPG